MSSIRINNKSFFSAFIFVVLFFASCGDGIVTKYSQLDGTYWKTCGNVVNSDDSLYHKQEGLIRFEDGEIYSGQTEKSMSYTYTDKGGKIGKVATFKIEGKGKLVLSMMTVTFPFTQISEAEYDSIKVSNQLLKKKKLKKRR